PTAAIYTLSLHDALPISAFIGIALIGAATFTSLFSYLSASSFVLQGEHGLTPQQYGYVFGLNSIGLVVSTQVSARLMRRITPSTDRKSTRLNSSHVKISY